MACYWKINFIHFMVMRFPTELYFLSISKYQYQNHLKCLYHSISTVIFHRDLPITKQGSLEGLNFRVCSFIQVTVYRQESSTVTFRAKLREGEEQFCLQPFCLFQR